MRMTSPLRVHVMQFVHTQRTLRYDYSQLVLLLQAAKQLPTLLLSVYGY